MINYYRTDNNVLRELQECAEGAWIKLTGPTNEELGAIANRFDIDITDIRAALDDEESARIHLEDGYTLILEDIPMTEIRNNTEAYTTIPLGILLTPHNIITVCASETPILNYFINNPVKEFSTKKQMRFVYQILYQSSASYQMHLRTIDRRRVQIEARIYKNTEDADLISLYELESNLVYFATSLRGNAMVLERLTRYERIKQYPEDKEFLDDVIIEHKQAIEMTQIYRDIINGTRELLSTIINNRMNNIMKYLAAITIVMSIPTIVSSFYGMNIGGGMPLDQFWWFPVALSVALSLGAAVILVKKDMFH